MQIEDKKINTFTVKSYYYYYYYYYYYHFQTSFCLVISSALTSGPYPGVKREVWRGIKGSAIRDMAVSKYYPHHPSQVSTIPNFVSPEYESDDAGSRISGYFVAPYTGEYTFTLSADNEAELFLSENSQEKNKDIVAGVGALLARRHLGR